MGETMRRIAVLAGACAALALLCISPAGASAAFTQCPAVDLNGGCQFLVNVTDAETTIETDTTLGPYEGADDALIGVVNNSSKPISSIPLSAENQLFGFEGDGICTITEKPAPGCVVLAQNESGEPNLNAGETCPPATFGCGFPPPAGEPAGVTFPEGIGIVGRGANGDPVTGYEGPTSWFTGIGNVGANINAKGVVNFSPAIAPGGTSYFSLESPPIGGFGLATALGTTLSGGGQSGPVISVLAGTPVTDTATLSGANAATATGKVTFNVYSDAECKTLAVAAGEAKLASASAGPSSAISTLAPGTYYWQAHYNGNTENQPVTSACGSEVLTVLAATTTTTIQTGGGVTGASIPVLLGSSVKDQAHIAGTLAASATGTVTYALYKDKKCTVPAAPSSTGAVLAGVAAPSAAVKPGQGTYYWVASYSGGGLNAPSASACGSEVLIVSIKKNLNLPSNKGCASKRHFVVHPRGPKSLKLVKVRVFINGKFSKEGRLHNGATTLSLVGLPKGTFKVAFVASTASGKTYEDTRTFHTCVPKKKKHKKH
jgi:hypothetical protein